MSFFRTSPFPSSLSPRRKSSYVFSCICLFMWRILDQTRRANKEGSTRKRSTNNWCVIYSSDASYRRKYSHSYIASGCRNDQSARFLSSTNRNLEHQYTRSFQQNERSYSETLISSHFRLIDEIREDKRPLDVRILSDEAKTCYKIDRLSFANLTRMNENGSTVSRRTRKSEVTWSNPGEGIKHPSEKKVLIFIEF